MWDVKDENQLGKIANIDEVRRRLHHHDLPTAFDAMTAEVVERALALCVPLTVSLWHSDEPVPSLPMF